MIESVRLRLVENEIPLKDDTPKFQQSFKIFQDEVNIINESVNISIQLEKVTGELILSSEDENLMTWAKFSQLFQERQNTYNALYSLFNNLASQKVRRILENE